MRKFVAKTSRELMGWESGRDLFGSIWVKPPNDPRMWSSVSLYLDLLKKPGKHKTQ